MDKRLFSPVEDIDWETYHSLIVSRIDAELQEFVTPEMTQAVYQDKKYRQYPVETTVRMITRKAGEARTIALQEEITCIILPGPGIVSIDYDSGDVTSRGWRPILLTKDRIEMGTVWGQRVDLHDDIELPAGERRRVNLPLFRWVTISGQWKEFSVRGQQRKRKNFTVRSLVHVNPQVVDSGDLLEMLRKHTIEPHLIDEDFLQEVTVLKGTITYFNTLDLWVDDPDGRTDFREVLGPDGKPEMVAHPNIPGRYIAKKEEVPVRVKDEFGQEIVQPRLTRVDTRSLDQDIEDDMVICFQLSVGSLKQDEVDRLEETYRLTARFNNNSYVSNIVALPAWGTILDNAIKLDHEGGPGRTPASHLDDCFRGHVVLIPGQVSRVNHTKARQAGQKDINWITFDASCVISNFSDVADCLDAPPIDKVIPKSRYVKGLGQSTQSLPPPVATRQPESSPEPEPEPEPEDLDIPEVDVIEEEEDEEDEDENTMTVLQAMGFDHLRNMATEIGVPHASIITKGEMVHTLFTHLTESTVNDLRKIAREVSLTGYSKLRKTELIQAITEAYRDVRIPAFGEGTPEKKEEQTEEFTPPAASADIGDLSKTQLEELREAIQEELEAFAEMTVTARELYDINALPTWVNGDENTLAMVQKIIDEEYKAQED